MRGNNQTDVFFQVYLSYENILFASRKVNVNHKMNSRTICGAWIINAHAEKVNNSRRQFGFFTCNHAESLQQTKSFLKADDNFDRQLKQLFNDIRHNTKFTNQSEVDDNYSLRVHYVILYSRTGNRVSHTFLEQQTIMIHSLKQICFMIIQS